MADILIIGGGVSGLSAGIYGLLSGHSVTVCEKNAVAGGNLTGWYRGEYYIDNCIHWLTGTNPASKAYGMWKTLGLLGSADVYRPESLYTAECCGIELSLYRDLQKFENEMLALSPADAREIRSLVKAVRAVQNAEGLNGNGRAKKDMRTLYRYYSVTTGELADRFRHPLIKKFISSFIGEDFGALALITVFAEFTGGNADLPLGGSLCAAKRIVRRFKELGGRLLLNKEAVKINVSKGYARSVSFSDNDTLYADYIVAAADPYYVFDKLTGLPLPETLSKMNNDQRYSRFSSCHAAFAADISDVPFSYDATIDVPMIYQNVLGSKYAALREFSFETSFAPEGKTVVQAMTFCGEERSGELTAIRKDEEEYKRRKESIAHCLQKSVEYAYPKLRNKLKLLDVWTPATYNGYFNSVCGSYMSFAFSKRTLPPKAGNRVKGAVNLILATQWLRSPGGLPNAAESGKAAIETVNSMSGSIRRRLAAEKQTEAAAGKSYD